MKVMAISVIILFCCLQFASSLDFALNSPSSVDINESFSASVEAGTSDIYDVKIFVQDKDEKSIISEIYNDGWKNPYYYLKSVFPGQSEFSNRVVSYSDNAEICARMRKTNATSYSEKCNDLKISSSSKPAAEIVEGQEESPPEETTQITKRETGEDFTPSQEPQTDSSSEQTPLAEDRIILTPPGVESSKFVSKEEKIRMAVICSFTLFTIIVIVLLALRKL